MKAVATLFPVLFMIGLGIVARIKNWVTTEQKDGANNIVFNILFPILIFNILFSSKFKVSALSIVLYVFIAYCLSYFVGKITSKFTGSRFAHVSSFLVTTCEGGNVALPLYLSIVGASSNTVIFDLAGVFFAFVVIPVMVAKLGSSNTSTKDLVKSIFTNSFVIAVILGLGLNLLGVYDMLAKSAFFPVYTNTIAQATAPIVGIILFIIGYNLKIEMSTIGNVLKLLLVRVSFYVLVIIGFFILFPTMMADKLFMMAVLIYFMCPPGFPIPILVASLVKNEIKDNSFMSAVISLNMVVTLLVYAYVVVFIA